ncbi:MAG: hypothetical protein AAFV95_20780 [Bacteroidota bacterium]
MTEIRKDDFEKANCGQGTITFEYNGIPCRLILDGLYEMRMSIYLYSDVRFFKGNRMLQSGEMLLPEKYYVPLSPDQKYIYIPFNGGGELINLETEEKLVTSVDTFHGNSYNADATKMILNGGKEFKVIDLLKMEEVPHLAGTKDHRGDAFFKNEHTIWQLKNSRQLEEHSLLTADKRLLQLNSPFETFGVSRDKYQSLIDQKTHCLALPDGSMRHSGELGHWNHVHTKDKVVLETMIPSSEIQYSDGHANGYCFVEYKYVQLQQCHTKRQ